MNKRQRKKKFKILILNNLAVAFKEVKLAREGKLHLGTWKELKEELKQFKE
jgi:hypothetical protein